jgi:hypothetical protein
MSFLQDETSTSVLQSEATSSWNSCPAGQICIAEYQTWTYSPPVPNPSWKVSFIHYEERNHTSVVALDETAGISPLIRDYRQVNRLLRRRKSRTDQKNTRYRKCVQDYPELDTEGSHHKSTGLKLTCTTRGLVCLGSKSLARSDKYS